MGRQNEDALSLPNEPFDRIDKRLQALPSKQEKLTLQSIMQEGLTLQSIMQDLPSKQEGLTLQSIMQDLIKK